ncbi:DNA mismatch repair endonuclease MutL [Clostridium sp.]|uniref:DNA mismatch repair endonuclease MutL n=1 Tax=Clostridium sp. TaxID=1506 RepID=UPI003F340B68
MKRINVLDEHTSNKIAAGEVVERPSSVVKELVENSIDANSKNITIEIEEGGTSLIRIIDDGDGIHREDVEKAFLPHATSKIRAVEDIYSINTLGFRGEALPSIASVAKVTLKSKTEEEEFGREVQISGGEFISTNDVGMNKGTTIEVRDLFFNVPARKKFLKTLSREGALINDIISRIALSNPDISFKLYSNGKKLLHTFGSDNLKDVIRTIYNKTISDNLIYFEAHDDAISLHGYIGKEEIAKGSRNNQTIFVNGRYIKNKTIVAAVENAFKSFATVSKFPFFVLFIEVYPEFVDVNIHPTKAEIKFKEERAVFKRVFDSVHGAFKESLINTFQLPNEEINDSPFEAVNDIEKIEFNMDFMGESPNNIAITLSEAIEEEAKVKYTPALESINLEESIKKEEDIYKKLLTMKEDISPIVSIAKEEVLIEDKTSIPSTINSSYNTLNSTTEFIVKETNSTEELPTQVKASEKTAKFPKLKVIGQFNKTYILSEYDDTLYIVDQHAAHEKILFEKYLKDIEEGSIIIQPLLVPTLIHLNMDDYCYYEENIDIFKNAGFIIEDFGGNTVALKEVPYFLGKLDAKNLFLDILYNVKSLGSGKTSEVKYNKISSMACRAAVKANDKLTEAEMDKLLEDLRYINDPFHCPHGRPIIIKFTNYDLDKKFRRIV